MFNIHFCFSFNTTPQFSQIDYSFFFTIVCVYLLAPLRYWKMNTLALPSVQSGSRCLTYNRSPKTQSLSSKHAVSEDFQSQLIAKLRGISGSIHHTIPASAFDVYCIWRAKQPHADR